jgi:hypothetical protein
MDRRASDWERQRAKELAKAVLDGRTTVLEAVRELVSLAHTDAIANEADRTLIIAIESETDSLPIGEVRKLWAPDAWQAKQPEIERAEALRKTEFLEACKRDRRSQLTLTDGRLHSLRIPALVRHKFFHFPA